MSTKATVSTGYIRKTYRISAKLKHEEGAERMGKDGSRQYQIMKGLISHLKEIGKGLGKKNLRKCSCLEAKLSSLMVLNGAGNSMIRF